MNKRAYVFHMSGFQFCTRARVFTFSQILMSFTLIRRNLRFCIIRTQTTDNKHGAGNLVGGSGISSSGAEERKKWKTEKNCMTHVNGHFGGFMLDHIVSPKALSETRRNVCYKKESFAAAI